MGNKMNFFLKIIIQIIIINYISSETTYLLIDHLFSQIKIINPVCLMKDPIIPSSRGKIEHVDEIIKGLHIVVVELAVEPLELVVVYRKPVVKGFVAFVSSVIIVHKRDLRVISVL